MTRRLRDSQLVEMLDVAIGIAAFFGLAFTGITVYLELTGKDALGSALTLLGLVVLLGLIVIGRRSAAAVDRRRRTTISD